MARIAAVQLDFLRPATASRLGPWLLVAGVLVALVVMLEHRQLSAQTQALVTELDELRGRLRQSRPVIEAGEADSPELRVQVKKANGVLEQLNVPWGELFVAIEAAQNADVALLRVQPDARSRTVQLGGAARSVSAVLAYMTRLERSENLGEVLLVSHKIKLREPGRPVEFVLNARWVEKR